MLAWWPVLVVLLRSSSSSRRSSAARIGGCARGWSFPGSFLAGVGAALLYTSLNDRWPAWSYLWTVSRSRSGSGMYAAGWIADAPAFKWIGSGMAAGGVVAYLAFATAFGGEAFRLVGALGIIGLGLALTIGGLAERLSRKSPAGLSGRRGGRPSVEPGQVRSIRSIRRSGRP